jgi:hypothetical protein
LVVSVDVSGEAIVKLAVAPGSLELETSNVPQLFTVVPNQSLVPFQLAVSLVDCPGASDDVDPEEDCPWA